MSRAPVVLLAILLAAPMLTGCIGQRDRLERDIQLVDGLADPDETRGEDGYWMVWIRGNETDERAAPFVCTRVAPDYRIEPANRTVVYSNRSYDFDPGDVRTLLALDHEDRSSQCPEAERLVADPGEDHVETMGEYGDLTLTVRGDGTLALDGREVPLGQAADVSYEGTPSERDKLHVDGSFRAEVLGAWPQTGLQPGDPT